MSAIDTRHIPRDSLFLLADLRIGGFETGERVKVRNLSAGGMMAEGSARVERGAPIAVKLRNIGWVDGTVAWIQDSRFGIAFAEEIDPKDARAPEHAPGAYEAPRFTRYASVHAPNAGTGSDRLRKV
jgi:hypothetical protein